MFSRKLRVLCLLLLALSLSSLAPRGAQAGQLGATVQDTKLGRVYIAVPLGNTVLVMSTRDMSLKAVIKVPQSPSALALDPTMYRLYVASDAAGMISVFDSRSYKLLQQETVGGHPAGLALISYGRQLLVSDSNSGQILRLTARPRLGVPLHVAALGSEPAAPVLLAPAGLASGTASVIWARGFQPNEGIDIYWGIHLLKHVQADQAGMVSTSLAVPAGSDLGKHLLILVGQSSAHSESALINVLPKPKPIVKPRAKVPGPSLAQNLQRLLKPRLGLAVPALPAVGPLKAVQSKLPAAVPVMPVMLLLVVIASIGLLRTGRARRKRLKEAPTPTAEQGKDRRKSGVTAQQSAPPRNLRRAS